MSVPLVGVLAGRTVSKGVKGMGDSIPLRLSRPGVCVQISSIVGGDDQVRRLHELGLRLGDSLTVLQAGSPCLVKHDRVKLSFRDGDSDTIFVREAV